MESDRLFCSLRMGDRLWLRRLTGTLLLVGAAVAWARPSPGASASDLEFFDTKVAPILTQRCFQCHSDAHGKVKGGLELDWQGGWQKGGNSGAAIVPGDPEKSLLIKAVGYADADLQMPPKGERLPDGEIATLREWVRRGAPDSRTVKPAAVAGKPAGDKSHWAFQPVKEPALPKVSETSWVATPVDAFVLAKLEENGMKHSVAADRPTLIRRVYFDLIGLPPTQEEADAFLTDSSPNAYEKVVDRLLASPHYGERWGRYWLDVARYSDTKGQFNRRRETALYPYAWTYRDYVIQAFNEDKPYDQFIREQLAADRLPRGRDSQNLAALGFLTLGDHYNGNQNEVINDRIDVVCKGFLGLTVTCARCHDHRFDPIPQADYYSLHGIFASSAEPPAKPLLAGVTTNSPAYAEYLRDRADLESRMQEVASGLITNAFGDYKRLGGVYLYATTMPEKDREAYLRKNGGDPDLLKNWQQLIRIGTRRETGLFRLWQFLQRVPQGRFPDQARRILANLSRDERTPNLPQAFLDVFQGQQPRTLAEVASLYGFLFAKNDPAWQASLNAFFSEVAVNMAPNRMKARYFGLREQFDRLDLTHPGAPARAMVLSDVPTPKDSPVFIRGEVGNPGAVVPRRFLEVLSPATRPVFTDGSGRLQLAQAIASPANPLTARVMVNRVWLHHFGEGLVSTPDDFGNQASPPSHPELLDWLAARFTRDGWSLKKLHRAILLSNTYQQSSEPNPAYAAKDPANRYLSHVNVRRLEYEPLRDSILYVSGKLDLAVGGKPVDLSEGTHKSERRGAALLDRMSKFKLSTAERRSIYGFIDRQDLLEVLNTFDFANPSLCSGRRYETTVPQQALFLMNSPLVVEQARNIVDRPDFKSASGEETRIRLLYALLFQRSPTEGEVQLGKAFIAQWVPRSVEGGEPVAGQVRRRPRDPAAPAPKSPPKPLSSWAEYTHALLMTTEMSYVR
jgi:hypothetical protein